MIMNGNAPTLISGVPKVMPSFATIRSHASAMPNAPASTWPPAAQMDGLPSSPSSRNTCTKRSEPRCLCTSGTSEPKPARFAPDDQTRSCEDASTTQRTASSSRAATSASISSPSSSLDSALRVSG